MAGNTNNKNNLLWILISVVCVALFVGAYFLYDSLKDDYQTSNLAEPVTRNESTEDGAVVETVPDFTALDENGQQVKLSDYFGKPIVLNLWASWCGPCKMEMPHFEKAYQENPDVQFLMVNLTSGDDLQAAKELIASAGYTFPVLFDTEGEAGYAYNATSIPMTIFIDKNGAYVTHAVGALSAETLETGISYIR